MERVTLCTHFGVTRETRNRERAQHSERQRKRSQAEHDVANLIVIVGFEQRKHLDPDLIGFQDVKFSPILVEILGVRNKATVL